MYDLQKANMWKRISAALFDAITIGIVAIGMVFLLSALLGYDAQVARFGEIREQYGDEYNVDFAITDEDYQKLTEEERNQYQLANDAFLKDEEANYIYNLLINYIFLMITVGILSTFILVEFVVPLLFGNGQTLGKKIFGIAVMRADSVKISPMILFARSILGKCTVETLVPLLSFIMIIMQAGGMLPLIFFAGVTIMQIAFFLMTKERKLIHDVMAQTVVVDMSSQMIFETPEALLEYKKKIQAEKAQNADY